MKDLSKSWLIVLIVIGAIVVVSCTEEKKSADQTEPVAKEMESMEKEPTQNVDSLSTVKESIEVDMSVVSSAKKGDSFTITKADGSRVFNLEVRRSQETIPGITSISANIEDRGTGLASLLLRDGKLSGLMDLYKERTRYRVGYDLVKGAHYVQEMPKEEMDVIQGSEPLSPGREGQ